MNAKMKTQDLLTASGVEIEKALPSESKLTILSYGGGQDSTTLLYKYVFDPEFKKIYAPNDFLVLFADTGNEAPMTYEYIENIIKPFCIKHNIEFVAITNDMGYHGRTWQTLTGQWENGNPTIGSVAYPKTCTANLKLNPQYRYVEEWLTKKYPEIVSKNSQKAGYVQFAKTYGPINWIVGIAKGEEKRCADAEKETAKWKRQAVSVIYPLIPLGLDRQKCQDYIKSLDMPIPFPSNCLFCPFAGNNKMELLWLFKTFKDRFYVWAALEQKKLDAHQEAVKNLGVCGKLHKKGDRKGEAITLLDTLVEAQEEFGHLSLNELSDYRFSHGHCTTSSY